MDYTLVYDLEAEDELVEAIVTTSEENLKLLIKEFCEANEIKLFQYWLEKSFEHYVELGVRASIEHAIKLGWKVSNIIQLTPPPDILQLLEYHKDLFVKFLRKQDVDFIDDFDVMGFDDEVVPNVRR